MKHDDRNEFDNWQLLLPLLMWNGLKRGFAVAAVDRLTAEVALEGNESSDRGVAVAVPACPLKDRPSPLASSSMNTLALECNEIPATV
jgi:hypothetical protein